MIALIYAHPYPDRSRANAALLRAAREVPGVQVRSLYDLYPDFAIDVEAEQRELSDAHTIVWQHPLYWYSVPSLMKHWFDQVLLRGWAYAGGRALQGKRCLWVATTGGEADSYGTQGLHSHAFEAYVPPIRQTALFCGMEWLEPLVVHGAHRLSDSALAAAADGYGSRLRGFLDGRQP